MDLSKLKVSDWLIGGGGLALFIFSFFPWYGADYGFVSVSINGWDSGFFGWFSVILGLVLVAYVVAFKVLDVQMPELPLPESLLVLIVAGVCALCLLIRLAFGASYHGVSVGLGRKFGLFLAVLSGLVAAGGAFLNFQAEGMPTSKSPGTGGTGQAGGGGNPTPF